MPTLLAYFGPQDLLIIGALAFLFFGNRLPSVMRSLGEGIVEFKKGVNGVPDENDAHKRIDDSKPAPHEEKQEAR